MCGLVGYLGPPTKRNREIFADMLCMDVKRGPHSTGVAMASRNKLFTHKETILPWDFLVLPEVQGTAADQFPLMMGHNRWATVGEVNVDNAHPFTHGDITLMHNGTVDNIEWYDSHKEFDTDSETLAYEINKNGVEETWSIMDGAATLTWFDKSDKTLNVLSNCKRPFTFTISKDLSTMYYSSEEWMLRFACNNRGVELEKNGWILTKDVHYKFKRKKGGIQRTRKEILGYEKKLLPWKPSDTDQYYQTGSKKSSGYKTNTGNSKVPLERQVSKLYTLSEWNKSEASKECVLCNGQLFWSSAAYLDANAHVCRDCINLCGAVNVKL